MIDYIFYRFHRFYSKNRDSVPKYASALLVSLLIFLTALNAYASVALILDIRIIAQIKPISLLLMILILLPIWRRYRNDTLVEALNKKYVNEDAKISYIKGMCIFCYCVLMLIIPIFSGYLRNK